MPSIIEQVIEEFRKRLFAREAEQMVLMTERWLEVEFALEARAALLADQIAAMRAAGEVVSASKLYRLENYQKLIVQAKSEVQKYARWSADLIGRGQLEYGRLGIESAVASIRAVYQDAGIVGGFFDLLPVEAIEAMIGFAGDGTPLYQLLLESYPGTVQKLTQTLIDAIAAGINPRQTARMMMEDMAGNLQRALTVARTEQLRAFREASRRQMKDSGVVEGWLWRAALQTRTCLACLAMDDGVTIHPLDEELHDHPNGRCFRQPVIKGLTPVETTSGKQWFEKQPAEVQKEMMGTQYYKAYKAGKFQFETLATTHSDPTWGTEVRMANLSDLAGERPAVNKE